MTLPHPRLIAAKLGKKRYQGKPCLRGHSGIRFTLTSNCVECSRIAVDAYREKLRALLAKG